MGSRRLRGVTSFDLAMTLVMSSGVLLMTAPLLTTVAAVTLSAATGSWLDHFAWWRGALIAGLFYLFAFGSTPTHAYSYWLRSTHLGFLRALWYAHLYAVYSYLWTIAGWRALYRMVLGRNGWAKTARTAVSPVELPALTPQEVP
jgi:hypothetical protein